jgi:outer membrane protein assembly factor BamB
MAVTGSAVVISAGDSPLVARDLNDGKTLWTSTVGALQLATDAGRIYAREAQQIHALDATTGAIAWTRSLPEPSRSFTLAGNRVFVVTSRALAALQASDGMLLWRQDLDSPAGTDVAGSAALVAVGLEDRSVAAFDSATGAPRWRYTFDTLPTWTMVSEDRVLVGLPRLATCALTSTGGYAWCTYQAKVPAVGPPLAEQNRLYLALRDGSFLTLDRSGTKIRSDALEGPPALPPGRIGNDLVVPLKTNAFIVVTPPGTISRVPAADGLRILQQAVVATAGQRLVSLATTVTEDMTLSVFRPKPPAPPSAAAAAPAGPPPVAPTPAANPSGAPSAPPAAPGAQSPVQPGR